ncbi:uncharacterized protein B0I36DRAFT_92050 [Microdochium trichocladiopsis]|uniref:Gamma interferon inducible lysosomal thiol reductase n=1 Tax=Microdochium trichocladiopsis TaxID=1682393 RepID=A0A9P9BQZ0_9PEZI|nr:uncharacterized protein B0I36DRAFT_92050 [Microdochium trichocladiopsis]KAH7035398.1 hypothetical protein B0I36DRAFT_92050 [Microdochium trichocladiopsis]
MQARTARLGLVDCRLQLQPIIHRQQKPALPPRWPSRPNAPTQKMAAKNILPTVEDSKLPVRGRAPRRHRAVALFLIATIVLYCLYSGKYTATRVSRIVVHQSTSDVPLPVPQKTLKTPAFPYFTPDADLPSANTHLVPLEAHIMSKCPDAKDCLKELVLPAMMRVYDKVNFTLSYIGTPTENDGVECKHGPNECMGNIIELCAAHLYPDPKIYLGFTMCLTRDYKLIPQRELVEDCALEHGIDFGKLNNCAAQDDGALGMSMLRSSVQRTAAVSLRSSSWGVPFICCCLLYSDIVSHPQQAGVTKSCTVRLDEQIYCIRDDGEWSDCPSGAGVNDLVIAVEKIYRRS